MKYFVYLISLLMAFHTQAEPLSPQAAIKAKLAASHLLTDITSTGQNLVAVGKWGNIVTSVDAKNWQQANVPVQSLLTAVFFIDELHGWAVGHDATILKTNDGGDNWNIQNYQPDLDKPLLDVYFFDQQHGIAMGAYGLFYRTLNGGKTWLSEFQSSLLYPEDAEYLAEIKEQDPEGYEIETASILPHFNSVFNANGRLYLVGEVGLIAYSDDQGKQWSRFDEIYSGSFFAIAQLKNKQLIAGGLRGTIFTSSDLGKSWQQIDSGSNASINGIFIDHNIAYLSANNGVIFKVSDQKVERLIQPDGKAVMAVIKKNKELVLATEAGIKTRVLAK